MKNASIFRALLIFSLLFFSTKNSMANHAAGGEIIYTHIGGSSYQFILKFYRDCGGPPAPGAFNLCVFNTCTNQQFTVPLDVWPGALPDGRNNGDPVSLGCSNGLTGCDPNGQGAPPGYEEWWYTCIISNLPLQCNYWKFGCLVGNASLCCRNASNSLQGTPSFYIETTFNNTVYSKDANGQIVTPWENSSPYYSVRPVPYVCNGIPFNYNNGAIDPDGDSLWSQLVQPLASASCSATPTLAPLNLNANPPINFTTNPFPANNTFQLNNNTGQMSFTAAMTGAGTITMQTKEFRKDTNNVVREIGSIMRDVQIQVLNCTTIVPDVNPRNVDNGVITNGIVYGCAEQSLEYCFTVTSSDKDAVLFATDNLSVAIPGATMTYKDLGTDTVEVCFKWTPTLQDVGRSSFIVQIKDSTCRPPGILFNYVRTVELQIWGPIEVTPDTSICTGESAFLGVTGGGNYEWTVVSGTDPSLSNRFIANPIATPTASTVYSVVSRANPYCPDLNKDTVEINLISGPEIGGQLDDTTCPNHPVKMDIGLKREPNANYTINWTPSTGLNNSTIEDPVTTLKSTTNYIVEVNSDINRCKTFDTVLIDVLTGFNIENPDTAICDGSSIEIRGQGDSRYNYIWVPEDAGAVFSNINAINTSITPSQVGKYKYVLHATYFKCQGVDSIADVNIDLQPIPAMSITNDATLCFGDTIQLEAIVTPSGYPGYIYDWTPGEALNFTDRRNPIFSAITVGVTDIRAIVSTSAGCSDTATVSLNIYDPEFITIPDDTTICAGDSIKLEMSVADDVKFYWVPDFNISSISAMQPMIWPVTQQQYSVYAVDALGCLDTAEININVSPAAVLDIPDSVSIYPGEKYRMDPGGNCLYYTWFPPLGLSNADVSNPVANPDVNTRYVVNARTEAGCSITDSIDIYVDNTNQLEVPNAFTPGKRSNSTLKVISRGQVDLKSFSIYNRWGQKVFETTDINYGWDGTYDGESQPVGVYIYTVEAITQTGKTINKQGNVTLIR